MSLLDEASTERSEDRLGGLSLIAWVQIITVAALMCALFRTNLVRLWGKTNPFNGQDINWQHSIFVPLIGLYYLYIHRDDLLRAAAQPLKRELGIRMVALAGVAVMALLTIGLIGTASEFRDVQFQVYLLILLGLGLAMGVAIPTSQVLGTVLLLEGLLVFVYGISPGYNDYVKDLGMVITLFGVVTLLGGWPVMRVAWFPVVFLIVALPWPELVYAKLAWPLQRLAASVAVGTLRLCGVMAQNSGTRITMFGAHGEQRTLNVAEACAGLKSVMTFLMVAGSYAFLSMRPMWERVVIALSAVPIAIFCNVLRVTGQGLLDYYWSHEVSEGFAHQFVGLVMIIPGFFLIMLTGWILEKVFIEEADKRRHAPSGGGAASKSKRMIVEVPRKKETVVEPGMVAAAAASAPAAPTKRVALAGTQVASPPPAKPVAASAAKPIAPPSTLKPSTLKPARTPPAMGIPAGSTLKPSSKPVAPRTAPPAVPPSTLKPPARKPPQNSKPESFKPEERL